MANSEDDCLQLQADGHPITPAGLNVTGLRLASRDGLVVTTQSDPMEQQVASIDWDGGITFLTSARPSTPSPRPPEDPS